MKRIIRFLTKIIYKNIIKPILFRHKPDVVHHSLVKMTKVIQRLPLIREMPKMWGHNSSQMLSQSIAGISFKNPVGLSAGFDKEVSMTRMIKAVGFGWMMGGSVTWGQYKGNDGAWFYRLPKTKSLVVNAGLPSEGTEVVARRVAATPRRTSDEFVIGISVAKTNTKSTVSESAAIDDYCASLRRFDELDQVKLLEINISCPNTFGGEPFTTTGRLEKLLNAVDKLQLTKPSFVKMPINLEIDEFDALLKVIVKHNITGVTIGNLQKNRQNVDLKDKLPSEIKGNLSGAPAKEITNQLIRHTYQKYSRQLIIIGVGGIFNAEDAYEKIKAGSSLIGLITGLIFEGPTLAGDINHGLEKLLKQDGFTSISQAIGADVKSI